MTQIINTQEEKKQAMQDLINLNRDPELAIFKAIKAVEKKVDNMCIEDTEEEEVTVNIQIV